MGAQVAASVNANKAKPGYWRTLRSELIASQSVFSSPVYLQEHCGDIPLLLLRADRAYNDVPDDVCAALAEAPHQTHRRIVSASARGKQLAVPGAAHDIQLERLQAVVSAVQDVLNTVAASPETKPRRR
ncbi:hypothetical protein [Cognatilysobacter bugurensis]|uniref:Alpha/beta hydrolase n=1 Tax=Cognatilysobacter bugurensis TaxID=543356 RepID=A0A918T3P4_9GAMM|nr:hypothetical protein [Lysobacter bugurensis]GHA86593.1 hypothetical protein GCM10007067_25810 [Lysobacter bugurensis]